MECRKSQKTVARRRHRCAPIPSALPEALRQTLHYQSVIDTDRAGQEYRGKRVGKPQLGDQQIIRDKTRVEQIGHKDYAIQQLPAGRVFIDKA